MIKRLILNSDSVGIASSTLCFVHCLLTPFIFIAKSCSLTCCHQSPLWWKSIDFFFLLVSFYAVYSASKISNKKWVKVALYAAWFLLLVVIGNEYLLIVNVHENIIFIPAIALISLHWYNQNKCKCDAYCCNSSH